MKAVANRRIETSRHSQNFNISSLLELAGFAGGPRTACIVKVAQRTVDELYEDLLQDYCINGQAVDWAESVWNVHLKDFFSAKRAADLASNQIAAYVEKRRKRRPLRPRSIANLRCCAGPSPLGRNS